MLLYVAMHHRINKPPGKGFFFSVYENDIFFAAFKLCLENRAPPVASAARSSKNPEKHLQSIHTRSSSCSYRYSSAKHARIPRKGSGGGSRGRQEKTRDKETCTAEPDPAPRRSCRRRGLLLALLAGWLWLRPHAAQQVGRALKPAACAAAAAPEMDLSPALMRAS